MPSYYEQNRVAILAMKKEYYRANKVARLKYGSEYYKNLRAYAKLGKSVASDVLDRLHRGEPPAVEASGTRGAEASGTRGAEDSVEAPGASWRGI